MRQQYFLPIAYLLGFWCCYHLQPAAHDEANAPVVELHVGQTSIACPPKVRSSSTSAKHLPPAQCACNTSRQQRKGIVDLNRYRSELSKKAISCTDMYASERKHGSPLPSTVIGNCALQWLVDHADAELDPKRAQILFDYSYNGMEYRLPSITDGQWVYLTSLLPEPSLPLPDRRVLANNQLLLGKPSGYRVRSLFTTNSLFDVQFALRMEEIFEAVRPVPAYELLAGIIGMARLTYLILPCNATATGLTDMEIVKQAIRKKLSRVLEMGLHQLDVQVEVAAVFKYKKCVKELLKVYPMKIHRGVRLKWCYYPLGTKYDLIYRRGDMVQLVHRYILQWTRFGGDKVKTIRKWYPSINMGDILGWGLPKQQREVLFWDMLTQPSCPDPAIQNWLLSRGGRVVRIDPNQQSWKNKHPVGRQYVEFLRIFLCVSRGTGWRQKFDGAVSAACMSCSGGSLIHVTQDKQYKFFQITLHQREGQGHNYAPVDLGDAVAKNEYPDCPACNQCVMHSWRSLKLFWHNNKSLPPPACTECYECQRKHQTGGGISLKVDDIHGCTDVEGVADDDVERGEYCYDTQLKPVPRPSAPLDAIKKGPY